MSLISFLVYLFWIIILLTCPNHKTHTSGDAESKGYDRMDIEKDNHSPNYKDKSDNYPDLNMEPPYQTENYKEQAQPNPNGNYIKQSDEFEGIQITGSLKVDKNDQLQLFS